MLKVSFIVKVTQIILPTLRLSPRIAVPTKSNLDDIIREKVSFHLQMKLLFNGGRICSSRTNTNHLTTSSFNDELIMKNQALLLQLQTLQQKSRNQKALGFYLDFSCRTIELQAFLQNLQFKIKNHYENTKFFRFIRNGTIVDFIETPTDISVNDVRLHLDQSSISIDEDELLFESIINSLLTNYRVKLTSQLTLARRKGRNSGALAAVLIAKECLLNRKPIHVLAHDFYNLSLE